MPKKNGGLGKLRKGYTAHRVSKPEFDAHLDSFLKGTYTSHHHWQGNQPTLTIWYDWGAPEPLPPIAAREIGKIHDRYYIISKSSG